MISRVAEGVTVGWVAVTVGVSVSVGVVVKVRLAVPVRVTVGCFDVFFGVGVLDDARQLQLTIKNKPANSRIYALERGF